MKLIGYCTDCHRFGRVEVTHHEQIARALAGERVAYGVCSDCEEEEAA